MFSPVLAANNNHMLDLLPNVYFISSLVHNEDSGEEKKKKVSLLRELLTRAQMSHTAAQRLRTAGAV